MKEFTFVINMEKCSGRFGCVGICKNWRKVEIGRIEDDKLVAVKYRRMEEHWYGSFPNTNPLCVEKCPTASITKNPEAGIVTVEQETCISC